jgi:hypothetical protein
MFHVIRRICRRADLPPRGWHALRHSFGTHAALLGVNPWRLQAWPGPGRIDETMLYVHVAQAHRRERLRSVPGTLDRDERVLYQLGQRVKRGSAWQNSGKNQNRRNGSKLKKASTFDGLRPNTTGAGEGT